MSDDRNEEAQVEFKIIENGPILVTGDFSFVDSTGNRRELGNKLYICRCGKSEAMPFCDRSHRLNCFNR
jgi:CDGSH-type Zn-finger protein